ncbi:MAG: Endonuclease/exonuclease/phosphatase, partial [uncultured Blastococcus sp.]
AHRDLQHPARPLPGRRPGRRRPARCRGEEPGRRRARPAGGRPRPAALSGRRPDRGGRRGDGGRRLAVRRRAVRNARRHLDGRDRGRAARLGQLRRLAAVAVPGGVLAGGAAPSAAGQRAAVVPPHQPPVPGAGRTPGGGGRRPGRAVRPVHGLQHAPVLHPGVEPDTTAPAGAFADRHPRAPGPDRRPQHAAAGGDQGDGAAVHRHGRHLPGGPAAAAAGPRPGAGRPDRDRAGAGPPAAPLGPPRTRRPVRSGL